MPEQGGHIWAPGEAAPHAPRYSLLWLLAALAVVFAAVMAGIGTRFGFWHFRTGFAILKWAAYGGVGIALLSVLKVLAAARRRDFGAIFLPAFALMVCIFLVGVLWNWQRLARQVPPIHDITTDTIRPPQFLAIVPLRKEAPNSVVYGGEPVAAKQRSAYDKINTAILDLPPDQVFNDALAVAKEMGWEIVAAVPQEGRIEATDTTFWFGFKDDIVIRITPADYRSLVDIRSVSRVGRSDAGTNARRIYNYLSKLEGKKG